MIGPASHLRSVATEDGAAVLDTELGTLTTLNPTGAYIWKALERGESEEMIVAGLARETGVSANTVERDVHDFIASLEACRLIAR
jgi:hypothetical protein